MESVKKGNCRSSCDDSADSWCHGLCVRVSRLYSGIRREIEGVRFTGRELAMSRNKTWHWFMSVNLLYVQQASAITCNNTHTCRHIITMQLNRWEHSSTVHQQFHFYRQGPGIIHSVAIFSCEITGCSPAHIVTMKPASKPQKLFNWWKPITVQFSVNMKVTALCVKWFILWSFCRPTVSFKHSGKRVCTRPAAYKQ